MKDTGVIRKIDELGRIVVPKEIRKNLNINSSDDVQIYIEEDKIILKKYQKMLTIKDYSQKYIDLFNKFISSNIVISDKEKIIASNNKEMMGKNIDKKVLKSLEDRKILEGNDLKINEKVSNYLIIPIIVDADSIGSIMLFSDKEITKEDKLLSNIMNLLLISLIN